MCFFDDEYSLEEGVDDDFFPHPLLAERVRAHQPKETESGPVRSDFQPSRVRQGRRG